ncbi:50S ribosomal protein L34e [Candidatus Micrarchaeota archaeon]|nr:50S ribosomal protein L34e [Candidatus Micrarchaeota archaeon]
MPFPRHRSRSSKKHLRRVPSGRVVIHYQQGRGKKHVCAICSSRLPGVKPRSAKVKKLSKTEKRPERIFGGVLCSNCVQRLLKEKTRLETGAISAEDVALNHLKFLEKLS